MKKSRLLLLLLGVGIFANSIAAPPQVPLIVTVQGDGTVIQTVYNMGCGYISNGGCYAEF